MWAACYGESPEFRPNTRCTKEQCDYMLVEDLQQFNTDVRSCLTVPDTIPEGAYVAFLALTYNVGSGAFCRSTLVRKERWRPRWRLQ